MDFASLLSALMMGIVEGLTEFLPISSTGHLILLSDLIGFQGPPGKTFEIVIQLGAILAVIVVYWRDLIAMATGFWVPRSRERYAVVNLILAFIPAMVLGALLHKTITEVLFNPYVVCFALIIGGVIWASRDDGGSAGGSTQLPDGVTKGEPIEPFAAAKPAKDAPVVDVYEDFRCPICQVFEQKMGASINELAQDGRIRLRVHLKTVIDTNTGGNSSAVAGSTAVCAADQGRWEEYHSALFALQPAHISHYQLTLEPNTVFFARPPQGIPDEDNAWDMQEHCQSLLAQAGFSQYEVSAYARPGRQSAHNLNYWRFGDYLGIGAGAHGKISSGAEEHVLRRWKLKHPQAYLDSAGTPASFGGDDVVAPERLPFEYMLNLLRLHEGFGLRDFESRTGLPRSVLDAPLGEAVQRGWLDVADGHVQPTELGRRFTNDVVSLFLEE